MKKIFFVLLLLMIAILISSSLKVNNVLTIEAAPSISNSLLLKELNKSLDVDRYKKIEIPKDEVPVLPVELTIFNQTVAIKSVGLTDDGAMDTTDDAKPIAWYRYGATPLEEGNTLLAGHNTWKGEKGTFHNLKGRLKLGDQAIIKMDNGELVVLELVELLEYPRNQVPIEKMKVDGRARVTMITCSGKFLENEGTSENRTFAIFERRG